MVNLLHDVRYTGISLSALLSLGMSGGQTRCPVRSARAARPQPTAPAPAHAPAPAPTLASSWMDYVDFRRGSGDALTNLGGPALAATLARPRHPTPDS
jgi:hypothetical protein